MNTPHIHSAVIGQSLPTFAVSADLGRRRLAKKNQTHTVKLSEIMVSLRKPAVFLSSVHLYRIFSVFICGGTLVLGALYLYNVNVLQGLVFKNQVAEKNVRLLQDEQRQLQVQLAGATAHLRSEEALAKLPDFIAIGTPEFARVESTVAVTMR